MGNGDEHREFTRVPVKIEGELRLGDRTVRGEIEDVSMKGVFVECGGNLPSHSHCDIVLTLHSGDETVHIDAKGVVVRNSDSGIGIEFTDIDLDSFNYLRDVIRYNAADADTVEQEFEDSVGLKRRKD